MERTKYVLTVGVYGIGTAATVFLAAVVASGWELVLFPDAMLPMRISELASVWLAWGAFPMGIASMLLYRMVRAGKVGKGKRKAACVFSPDVSLRMFFRILDSCLDWFAWTGGCFLVGLWHGTLRGNFGL